MLVYCANCGTSNSQDADSCLACGGGILEDRRPNQLDKFSTPINSQNTIITPLPKRKPLWWVLLSIFVPFFIYFYVYINFQDMNNLEKQYHPKTLEEGQDPLLMLLIFIIFPPLTIYYKFEQLHTHLQKLHAEDPNIPNGRNVIFHTLGGMLVIFMVFLLIVYTQLMNLLTATALVAIAFGIHLAFYHLQWQKEMNKHILRHEQMAGLN